MHIVSIPHKNHCRIGQGDRTIEAYYRDIRNIIINKPDLPLVRIEGDTRNTMFPMQCCQVAFLN